MDEPPPVTERHGGGETAGLSQSITIDNLARALPSSIHQVARR
jgi:hypothetical protein